MPANKFFRLLLLLEKCAQPRMSLYTIKMKNYLFFEEEMGKIHFRVMEKCAM